MQIKKIFLASSTELKDDRREFELLIGRLNQQWRLHDLMFEVRLWEDFIDAMSPEGLQKEYDRAVADCDIFVMMFFTKVGRYTLEEFETAFAKMKAGGGPRVFTYFRNDFILTGDIDEGITSLLTFKARLKELNHYVTVYRNTQDLQYQFSRQLEKLYGEEGADALEVDDRTRPVKAGEIALLLAYRHLYSDEKVDVQRMAAAAERASRPVRDTLYHMASEMRRENWLADKRLMERTIPVLEVLTRTDRDWHAPWGQLGYALVEKVSPDWPRGRECLDRAAALRGDRVQEGYYYNYNRARCAVQLDPAFTATPRRAADAPTREAVLEVIRQARQDLGATWDDALKWASSETLREWLTLNGSPRRRGQVS